MNVNFLKIVFTIRKMVRENHNLQKQSGSRPGSPAHDLGFFTLKTECIFNFSRCGCHKLCRVCVTDFTKIIKESPQSLQALHTSSFAKCQQIWNGSRRPKGSGAIKDVIGKAIKYPAPTRWNSIPDCLQQLLEYYKHDSNNDVILPNNTINQLLYATGSDKNCQNAFTQKEINYLLEFSMLMAPICSGLDCLQSDKNESAFYGFFAPILYTVKMNLEQLSKGQELKLLKDAARKLVDALVVRFKPLFDLSEESRFATAVAVSHPKFKLYWLQNESRKKKARKFFEEEVFQFEDIENSSQICEDSQNQLQKQSGDYFSWMKQPKVVKNDSVSNFLNSCDTDLSLLNQFPSVKKVFMKFNTPLASSGTIERVFNYGGMLDDAKRNRISPQNLENNIILKANQVFKNQM
jgi:hypothetical protein